jgi:hypothetical protein
MPEDGRSGKINAHQEGLSMAAARYDPDWEPDPYEAYWEPADAKAIDPAEPKDALSVTHDLTDDELRRFVNFDVFYDPMPAFGFIPQWVYLSAFWAVLGAVCGLTFGNASAIVLGGSAFSAAFLGLAELRFARNRQRARELGLCDGRTVTITPRGLSVRIPGAGETSLTAIGPLTVRWSAIRKISVSERDLTFWMQPAGQDLEGRARMNVPLRAFGSPGQVAAFESAARRWHSIARGEDAGWWEEETS